VQTLPVVAFFDELRLNGFTEGQNLTIVAGSFGSETSPLVERPATVTKALPDVSSRAVIPPHAPPRMPERQFRPPDARATAPDPNAKGAGAEALNVLGTSHGRVVSAKQKFCRLEQEHQEVACSIIIVDDMHAHDSRRAVDIGVDSCVAKSTAWASPKVTSSQVIVGAGRAALQGWPAQGGSTIMHDRLH
jgi:hypothetical protein